MLDLRRDFYVRMAISAQKDKSLNIPFKTRHIDSLNTYSKTGKNSENYTDDSEETTFEKKISDIPLPISKPDVAPQKMISKIISIEKPTPKIEDKVNNIVNNPQIAEIKVELEVAEELLKKIKTIDKDNPKIVILENTVSRLKAMLEQKSYV